MDKNMSGMIDQNDFSQFDGLSGLYHHQQPSQQCQSQSPSTVSFNLLLVAYGVLVSQHCKGRVCRVFFNVIIYNEIGLVSDDERENNLTKTLAFWLEMDSVCIGTGFPHISTNF